MTDGEPLPPQFSLDELELAAVNAAWDDIDAALPGLAASPEAALRAEGWLVHQNPDVRDLGASIFEKSTLPLVDHVIGELEDRMHSDENPYTRYRSAFALFSHGDRTPEVIKTIGNALADEDVAPIAQGYLDRLESEK